METITKQELGLFLDHPPAPCVSIFMPTHRAGAEVQQDPVRFKNLLRKAEEELRSQGQRAAESRELLKGARGLLKDHFYWQHQSDGLAVFAAAGLFRSYRLPLDLKERLVVGHRFHIKPLLPLFSGDGRFYILTLSLNHVRLFEGTHHSVRELDLASTPRSIDEALGYDQYNTNLQLHSSSSPRGGHQPGTVHGQGDAGDNLKEDILHYFQRVDRGLRDLLRDRRPPLVLAAVENHFPIFKEATTYPRLLDQGIPGNPDQRSGEELLEKGWAVVEPHFRAEIEEALGRYRALQGTGRTSSDVREILPAAHQGRVEVLFVARGREQWGKFDPRSQDVELHADPQPGDEDLLDTAAAHTFARGGTVHSLEADRVPEGEAAVALFRY